MDAYSYVCRGQVFANAETGNIVLLAISIVNFNWIRTIRYLIPVVAFAGGVVITEILRSIKESTQKVVHWRQISLALEIIVLTATAFLPQSMNLVVNSLISLTCGTQVASFAKFHGISMATTMCTGNLRSGTQNLWEYFHNNDENSLRLTLLQYGCIVMFIIGAMIGGHAAANFGDKSILIAALLLLGALVMMFSESSLH